MKQMMVVDMPFGTTAEQADVLLNGVCEQGYYVRTILPVENGVRAYLNKRNPEWVAQAAQAAENAQANRAARDAENSKALEIIKSAPRDSVRMLKARLAKAGIKRGKNWVCETRRTSREGVTR